jgi:hypothetical protein
MTKTDRNAAYLQRYQAGSNPFTQYAQEGGPGIKGKHLTNTKGDWLIGQDKTPVPQGAKFLVLVTEAIRGFVKFSDQGIVDARVGRVADNFIEPHRHTLGDMEEGLWQLFDGKPRDPWCRYVGVPMIELSPPHGDVTFTGTSWGAQLALKELCRVYGAEAHHFADCFPVVTLTTKNRPHKTYGQIKGPWFEVVGWATPEDVRQGRKAAPKPSIPVADMVANLEEAEADEIAW